ncbi:MAG: CoA-binding protein [Dehalococcoidia bacterium]|nr:CoA-binding protein [Dehalococcoidia bacterium]
MPDHFLEKFLYPDSVAVIGATQNVVAVNYHLVENLVNLGYKGKIYPVNPNQDEVLGIKTFKNFNDIGEYVDLVVISVAARNVLDIIRDLPGDKIGGMVLVTGGFSEIGVEGRKMQEEIGRILTEKGIRAIGPNALSPINSANKLAISFFTMTALPAGNVSFIFQSGMYEPRFGWMLNDFHLGIAKLIDLGNKMDINEVDALEYLSQDPDTKVICLHLEAVKGGGRRFFEVLRETTRRKPVIVLKGGTTEAGAKAAMSHTGSLVRGSMAVFDSALRQAGAIKADTLDDFLYLAKAFSYLEPPKGNRIAIATFPGGEAVLVTDAVYRNGLTMARPGQASYDKLKATFPAWEISLNPYDFGIIYTFSAFKNNHAIFIDAMAEDDNVDCIAVQIPPLGFNYDPNILCAPFLTAAQKGKPMAVWPPHMLRFDTEIIAWLEAHSVPVFPSGAIAVKCLAALWRYAALFDFL